MVETSNPTEPCDSRVRLEGVDQVKLHAVEPRFPCASTRHEYADPRCGRYFHSRSQNGVLKERIQSATVPPGDRRGGAGSNPPQTIDPVLQNVGGSALIAFTPGRNRGVLLFTQPRVPNLHVVLLFLLADTDVSHVSMRLLAEFLVRVGNRIWNRAFDGVVKRVRCGIQVVLILQKQVDRKARQPGLELVVQDQVGVKESRQEALVAVDIDVG